MTLRQKILLAQLPLMGALALLGLAAVWALESLGQRSQDFLRHNYQSVLAAQAMKETIERTDSAVLNVSLGQKEKGVAMVQALQRKFEEELEIEEEHINEPGEREAVWHIKFLWDQFKSKLDRFIEIHDRQATQEYYFRELEPALFAVKGAADQILVLNHTAMLRKAESASDLLSWLVIFLALMAGAALLAGLVLSAALTNRLLRPLSVLTQAVARLGKGDFRSRANVAGRDEIAHLAADFNVMAERLESYRSSSVDELMLAVRTARAVVDGIPEPVMVFKPNGRLFNFNLAAERLFNLNASANYLIDPAPELPEALHGALAMVLAGGGPHIPERFEEAVPVAVEGGERYYLPRITPVRERADGESVVGAVMILQDVTKLRHFDELKSDLVATVAHELKTPLTSLRMAVHLCLEGAAGEINAKQSDLLAAAREDCERLRGIVDELLDLARLQAGRAELRLKAVSAAELVRSALAAHQALAAEKRVTLRQGGPEIPALVMAEAERVQMVFANLIGNAIRHTPPGGEVVVTARREEGMARFEVADTGPGVPKEAQEAVFQRFYQLPGGGAAGLGLSIVRETVAAHGGQVGLVSEEGRGSIFWFTLPLAPEQ